MLERLPALIANVSRTITPLTIAFLPRQTPTRKSVIRIAFTVIRAVFPDTSVCVDANNPKPVTVKPLRSRLMSAAVAEVPPVSAETVRLEGTTSLPVLTNVRGNPAASLEDKPELTAHGWWIP